MEDCERFRRAQVLRISRGRIGVELIESRRRYWKIRERNSEVRRDVGERRGGRRERRICEEMLN